MNDFTLSVEAQVKPKLSFNYHNLSQLSKFPSIYMVNRKDQKKEFQKKRLKTIDVICSTGFKLIAYCKWHLSIEIELNQSFIYHPNLLWQYSQPFESNKKWLEELVDMKKMKSVSIQTDATIYITRTVWQIFTNQDDHPQWRIQHFVQYQKMLRKDQLHEKSIEILDQIKQLLQYNCKQQLLQSVVQIANQVCTLFIRFMRLEHHNQLIKFLQKCYHTLDQQMDHIIGHSFKQIFRSQTMNKDWTFQISSQKDWKNDLADLMIEVEDVRQNHNETIEQISVIPEIKHLQNENDYMSRIPSIEDNMRSIEDDLRSIEDDLRSIEDEMSRMPSIEATLDPYLLDKSENISLKQQILKQLISSFQISLQISNQSFQTYQQKHRAILGYLKKVHEIQIIQMLSEEVNLQYIIIPNVIDRKRDKQTGKIERFVYQMLKGQNEYSKLYQTNNCKIGYDELWRFKSRYLIYSFMQCMIKATKELQSLGIYYADFKPDNFIKFGVKFLLIDFDHAYLAILPRGTKFSYISKNLRNIMRMLLLQSTLAPSTTIHFMFCKNGSEIFKSRFIEYKKEFLCKFYNGLNEWQKKQVIKEYEQKCVQLLSNVWKESHFNQIVSVIKDLLSNQNAQSTMTKKQRAEILAIVQELQYSQLNGSTKDYKKQYQWLITHLDKIHQKYNKQIHQKYNKQIHQKYNEQIVERIGSQKRLTKKDIWDELKPRCVYAFLVGLTEYIFNNIRNKSYHPHLSIGSFKKVGESFECCQQDYQVTFSDLLRKKRVQMIQMFNKHIQAYLKSVWKEFHLQISNSKSFSFKNTQRCKSILIMNQTQYTSTIITQRITQFNIYQYIKLVNQILDFKKEEIKNYFGKERVEILKELSYRRKWTNEYQNPYSDMIHSFLADKTKPDIKAKPDIILSFLQDKYLSYKIRRKKYPSYIIQSKGASRIIEKKMSKQDRLQIIHL